MPTEHTAQQVASVELSKVTMFLSQVCSTIYNGSIYNFHQYRIFVHESAIDTAPKRKIHTREITQNAHYHKLRDEQTVPLPVKVFPWFPPLSLFILTP